LRTLSPPRSSTPFHCVPTPPTVSCYPPWCRTTPARRPWPHPHPPALRPRTLALDPLQLATHLKLARCLRAHKNTNNKQKNTRSMESLKREQGLALGMRTKALGTFGSFGWSQTSASYELGIF
jgi:hypothetical protein